MVMELAPLLMVTFVPAVIVAAAGPPDPPIISWPLVVSATAPTESVPVSWEIRTAMSVKLVAPVPPLATGRVPETPVANAT